MKNEKDGINIYYRRKKITPFKMFLIFYILILLFKIVPNFGTIENTFELLVSIIIDALITLIYFSPILVVGVAIKSANKKVRNESMSEIDFSNYKEYYRDILRKFSPIELSYIDEFNVDFSRDIVATILNLELKGKVIIKENIIEVLDLSDVDLRKSEKYILDSIVGEKVIIKNSEDIIRCAQEEALEDNLISKIMVDDKKDKVGSVKFKLVLLSFLSMFLILSLIVFVSFNIDKINEIIKDVSVLWVILFVLIFIVVLFGGGLIKIVFSFVMIKSATYSYLKDKAYKRTEMGEEINKRIEGLKNYIKNFSVLSERECSELVIWEDYLIYSVIFGYNQKIIDQLSSMIEIGYEVGKIYIEPVNK